MGLGHTLCIVDYSLGESPMCTRCQREATLDVIFLGLISVPYCTVYTVYTRGSSENVDLDASPVEVSW